MNISFLGLGKLGLCSAVCFASKGHQVIGMDANAAHVEALKAGQCPIAETDLPALLHRARPFMQFTTDTATAVEASEATFIIVPTPSGEDGRFVNVYLEAALDAMAPALARKKTFHIVNVVSTVMPGSCEGSFRPRLEAATGKRCGVDFGLVYNPEFIALGSVLRNFLNPDMVLIGTSDGRSAAMIRDVYASMVETSPEYAVMSLADAEMTKLSLNCFLTMRISFVNELTELCERTPGADVDVVTRAIGMDSRIGPKYLKGGLGFGGPCFPRDNIAMQRHAEGLGQSLCISPAVVQVNRQVVERIFRHVAGHVAPPATVAVLGLAYKAGTHIVEESQGVLLARKLLDAGYAVHLHDPQAMAEAAEALGCAGVPHADPYEAARGCEAVVLMTQWPQYEGLDWARVEATAGERPLLVDSWRMVRGQRFARFKYIGLGLGPAPKEQQS